MQLQTQCSLKKLDLRELLFLDNKDWLVFVTYLWFTLNQWKFELGLDWTGIPISLTVFRQPHFKFDDFHHKLFKDGCDDVIHVPKFDQLFFSLNFVTPFAVNTPTYRHSFIICQSVCLWQLLDFWFSLKCPKMQSAPTHSHWRPIDFSTKFKKTFFVTSLT